MKSIFQVFSVLFACAALNAAHAHENFKFDSHEPTHVVEVQANNKSVRNELANLGYALEDMRSDKVFIYGKEKDAARLKALGYGVRTWPIQEKWLKLDQGIVNGRKYSSYDQVNARLEALVQKYPAILSYESLGRSVENRDVKMLRISGKSRGEAEAAALPVAFYMGCHHAREHLSVEVPLMFAEYLAQNYETNADVKRLVDSRELYVAPIINPDGHVYDYSDGIRGRMWRKNRSRNNDGTFGTDLNRNYAWGWGTGGSSSYPGSDVFMGTAPFSEPESRNVRDFVLAQPRMKTLLSFHTFSELVLYPWGGSNSAIGENGQGNAADLPVFVKMAQQMATWNGYTPQQSSDLYIATGDTTDWAYGERGVFAFTFELSPSSMFGGGFYPNPATTIDPTFQANLKPLLYLLEYSDNPHRVLTEQAPTFESTPAKAGIPMASYKDLVH